MHKHVLVGLYLVAWLGGPALFHDENIQILWLGFGFLGLVFAAAMMNR